MFSMLCYISKIYEIKSKIYITNIFNGATSIQLQKKQYTEKAGKIYQISNDRNDK